MEQQCEMVSQLSNHGVSAASQLLNPEEGAREEELEKTKGSGERREITDLYVTGNCSRERQHI